VEAFARTKLAIMAMGLVRINDHEESEEENDQ